MGSQNEHRSQGARREPSSVFRPRTLLAVAMMVATAVLAGCGESAGRTGAESASASAEGVIDVEGGYTQDEQLAELESVVEVMREHFGKGVATIDGEPWSAELHSVEVTPRPEGDGVYRHEIRFDVAPEDLKEAYATAEKIADQLGLTENMNNSHGVTEHDKIFYGAGAAEGRGFLIASTTSGDGYRAFYQTRLSDDPSLQEAYDRIVEKNSQEREVDGPLQTDDRTSVPGYEGE
ncbi:hypothetical protein [Nesterenkonia halobia]|uniref:hypothetical protein n=1 Tax=Nesterenkonia halobia TaxID=37922 RepID=UPI0031D375B4